MIVSKKSSLRFSFTLTGLLLASEVLAYQEVYDVQVVHTQIDHSNKVCTITIDRDHANGAQCAMKKNFSWQCSDFEQDYRYELARKSKETGYRMDIRYSEYSCKGPNMLLLTVW